MQKMLRMGGFYPPIINESFFKGHQFVEKKVFFSTNIYICIYIYKYIYIYYTYIYIYIVVMATNVPCREI